jgi:hypothetical protein
MSNEPVRRFDVTLAALERSAHVSAQEQREEKPESALPSAAWAWDEERRQARLAGGA